MPMACDSAGRGDSSGDLCRLCRRSRTRPHIGYVYPAGGRQGTTFQVVVGGQFLDGVNDACVSGDGHSGRGGRAHQAADAEGGQRAEGAS